MTYDVPAIVALARACAPEIATEAVVPLVLTESGGDPLRINVNKGPRVRARSSAEGAAIVRRFTAAGYSVDVGLAQINSSNFEALGVEAEAVFEPCTNLRLAATVLQRGYSLAVRHFSGLDAISATYSLYNTGTLTRGFRNGYVGRVWSAAASLGSIPTAPRIPSASAPAPAAPTPAQRSTRRDQWLVKPLPVNRIEVFR